MKQANKLVRFVKRPTGRPDPTIFALDSEDIPEVGEGSFLLRNAYLSMDPALISRMRDEDNYAEKVSRCFPQIWARPVLRA